VDTFNTINTKNTIRINDKGTIAYSSEEMNSMNINDPNYIDYYFAESEFLVWWWLSLCFYYDHKNIDDNFGESIYIPIFPSLPSTSINEGIEQLSISKYNLLVKTTNNNDGDFRSSYQ